VELSPANDDRDRRQMRQGPWRFLLLFVAAWTGIVGLLPLWEAWHFVAWEAAAEPATLYQALQNLPRTAREGWSYEANNLQITSVVLFAGLVAGAGVWAGTRVARRRGGDARTSSFGSGGRAPAADTPVRLAVCFEGSLQEAELIAQGLAGEGITAVVENRHPGMSQGGSLYPPRVIVRTEDLPRARAWLDTRGRLRG
jgi:hypothetical protein